MTNKVLKKSGLQISDYINFGTTTKIETSENLENTEKFINNTGIVNSLIYLKNNLFGNKIKENTVNVIGGTEKKILNSGFKGERNEIPTKIAVNLINNSSLEDSVKLQDIWSNMLANAVTGKVDIKNSYIDILSQLTEKEVLFLDILYANIIQSGADIKKQGFRKSLFLSIQSLSLTEKDFEIIVDNLVRLNLIHTGESSDEKDASYVSIHMKRTLILITNLGFEFVKACRFN